MIRRSIVGLVAAVFLFVFTTTTPGAEKDITDAVGAIRAVGEKGAGNRAAQNAWKTLAELPAERLTDILAGLDGANPLAANYLRAAVDAVAERQLAAGGKLPADALEAFALDTSHDPRARRLSYEWLAKVDAAAPDRIIPKMLDDPSLELRRDAVARRIAAAAEQLDAGAKAEAAAGYRAALQAARDLDQIRACAAALKKLEEKVDLPRQLGFLTRWKIIGPFDNTNQSAFDKAYPPETQFDPAAKYPGKTGEVGWIDFETEDDYGLVDLTKALDKHKGAVAYAAAEFTADKARPVELRVGCINANKVWLNGKPLGGRDVYHTGMDVDQYVYRGELKPGKNVILVKVLQNEQTESWAQMWQFQLRVCDAIGTAVPSAEIGGE